MKQVFLVENNIEFYNAPAVLKFDPPLAPGDYTFRHSNGSVNNLQKEEIIGIFLYDTEDNPPIRLDRRSDVNISWDPKIYTLPAISRLEMVGGNTFDGYCLGGIRREGGVELADPISETIARVLSTDLVNNKMVVSGGAN